MPNIKWIKITTDMFDDEKIKLIEKMPEADGLLVIWVKLICQAGKVNDGGAIYLNQNIPFTEEDLATIFSREVNVVRLALATFKRLNMIELREDGAILLSNWNKHQNIDALERIKMDTRKRVSDYRGRQKLLKAGNVTVTLRNATEEDKNKNIEEDKNITTTPPTPPPSEGLSLLSGTVEEGVKKEKTVYEVYAEEIGKLTETTKNTLVDAVEHFSEGWVSDAIKEAVHQEHRNWKYVKGILENWARDGRDAGKPLNCGAGVGVGGQKSRDPDKYFKGTYGQMIRR